MGTEKGGISIGMSNFEVELVCICCCDRAMSKSNATEVVAGSGCKSFWDSIRKAVTTAENKPAYKIYAKL